MINFENIEQYKENNRIEAKKALGGLPESIWETYSAFANTLGGIILLGVEEHKDKSFHTIDLPFPEDLVDEFWELIDNHKKVNLNILSKKDVTIENINGKHIVAIRVPQAKRADKPIFINNNIYSGSYKRNGEGDYRCTKKEVDTMLHCALADISDATSTNNNSLNLIIFKSINSYLTKNISATAEDISKYIDYPTKYIQEILNSMLEKNIITTEEKNNKTFYKMKA